MILSITNDIFLKKDISTLLWFERTHENKRFDASKTKNFFF